MFSYLLIKAWYHLKQETNNCGCIRGGELANRQLGEGDYYFAYPCIAFDFGTMNISPLQNSNKYFKN